MPQVKVSDVFKYADDVEREIYSMIDHNGKKYAVTRSGHVSTVVLRHKKDGTVMVIHRKVHVYGRLANQIRSLDWC